MMFLQGTSSQRENYFLLIAEEVDATYFDSRNCLANPAILRKPHPLRKTLILPVFSCRCRSTTTAAAAAVAGRLVVTIGCRTAVRGR